LLLVLLINDVGVMKKPGQNIWALNKAYTHISMVICVSRLVWFTKVVEPASAVEQKTKWF
jgi:hypothetical protein